MSNVGTLTLDSRFCANKGTKESAYTYVWKLNQAVTFKKQLELEYLQFKHSDYVFSPENNSDRFEVIIYTEDVPTVYPLQIKGLFDDVNDFVKKMKELLTPYISFTYDKNLLEFKISHNSGAIFEFNDNYNQYTKEYGNFMKLLGFKNKNTGAHCYTNINIPKLFDSQFLMLYVAEFGGVNVFPNTMKNYPHTFVIPADKGFEIQVFLNSAYPNVFYLNEDITTDKLTITIRDSDGSMIVGSKGDQSLIIHLKYYY